METPKPTTPEEKTASTEREKRPLFIVYRQNDLFDRYVPFMIDIVREQDYQVNLHTFPAGTPEEEIKKWHDTHKDELDSMDIFFDYTTLKSSKSKKRPKIILDVLMEQASAEAICGKGALSTSLFWKIKDNYDNPDKLKQLIPEYLHILGEKFKRILTSIPQEKRQNMEVIIIKGIKGGRIYTPLIEHERYASENNVDELIEQTDEFSEKMTGWFHDSGIQKTTILPTGADIPLESVTKLLNGQAYIVLDRHTAFYPFDHPNYRSHIFWGYNAEQSEEIINRAALRTPIETFYHDVQRKIGISANPQAVEEAIKKRLLEGLTKRDD